MRPPYRGHVATGIFGKTLLLADAGLRALVDPRQARMVGVVGEVTGERRSRRMHSACARTRSAAQSSPTVPR